MPGWLFAGNRCRLRRRGVVFVRSTQKGAFVERLPVEQDEDVLLEEEGLKLFHRFRRMAVRGGGRYSSRAGGAHRSAHPARDGRARGQAQVRDPDDPRLHDPGGGRPGDRVRGLQAEVRLQNGYPTYAFSAADVSLDEEHGGGAALRIDGAVPGGWSEVGRSARGEDLDEAGAAIPGRGRLRTPVGLSQAAIASTDPRLNGQRLLSAALDPLEASVDAL